MARERIVDCEPAVIHVCRRCQCPSHLKYSSTFLERVNAAYQGTTDFIDAEGVPHSASMHTTSARSHSTSIGAADQRPELKAVPLEDRRPGASAHNEEDRDAQLVAKGLELMNITREELEDMTDDQLERLMQERRPQAIQLLENAQRDGLIRD